MSRTNPITLAAAIGAASLFAFAAVAQQASDTPAPAAPAAEQPATTASPAEEAAPAEDPGERWGRDRRGDRMWGGGMGRGMRGGMAGHGRSWSNLPESDRKAMMEARIAAVRAGLQLTEEQSKLWDPAETAMREFMQKQMQWREQMRGQERPASPIERMERRADMMSERGASLKEFAQAVRPLYDSLDEDQKRRLGLLSRHFHLGMAAGPGPQRRHHMERRGRSHGGYRDGYGYRQRGSSQDSYQRAWREHGGYYGRSGSEGPSWRGYDQRGPRSGGWQ